MGFYINEEEPLQMVFPETNYVSADELEMPRNDFLDSTQNALEIQNQAVNSKNLIDSTPSTPEIKNQLVNLENSSENANPSLLQDIDYLPIYE